MKRFLQSIALAFLDQSGVRYLPHRIDPSNDELVLKARKHGMPPLKINSGILGEHALHYAIEKIFGEPTYQAEENTSNMEGFDYETESGLLIEVKTLSVNNTTADAKSMGDAKKVSDLILIYHPETQDIFIAETLFLLHLLEKNWDKKMNTFHIPFLRDLTLDGKGKRMHSKARKNTEILLDCFRTNIHELASYRSPFKKLKRRMYYHDIQPKKS
jgi:hypothetical protein